MSDSLWPHGLYSSWNSLGQNSVLGSLSLLQELFPTQRLNPGLPHCRWILPVESEGKPKNTGVGSLSLLQWIFLTQELNQGLLHYRQILYQLSYSGSPLTSSEWISSVWILPFKEWCSTKFHRNLLSWLHLFPAPALRFSSLTVVMACVGFVTS